MNPKLIIVQDYETQKFVVCLISELRGGVPVYQRLPGINYEHVSDAARYVINIMEERSNEPVNQS